MPNYAVIQNGFVSQVIVADDLESAQQVTGSLCVESTEENLAGIGMAYNETTGFALSKPTGETNA